MRLVDLAMNRNESTPTEQKLLSPEPIHRLCATEMYQVSFYFPLVHLRAWILALLFVLEWCIANNNPYLLKYMRTD